MFRAEDNQLQTGIDFFSDAAPGQLQKNPVCFLTHPFVYERESALALFGPEGQRAERARYHIEHHQPADPLADAYDQDLRRWGPLGAPKITIDQSMDHLINLFDKFYKFSRDNNLFLNWVRREKINGGAGYCIDGRSRVLQDQNEAFKPYILERRRCRDSWRNMDEAMNVLVERYLRQAKKRLIPAVRPNVNSIDQLPNRLQTGSAILDFIVRNYNDLALNDHTIITEHAARQYLGNVLAYDFTNEAQEKLAAALAYADQRFQMHAFDQIASPVERREAVDLAIAGVEILVLKALRKRQSIFDCFK